MPDTSAPIRQALRDALAKLGTDIDDPLLERAERDGIDWRDLAAREIALFGDDMAALRVIAPGGVLIAYITTTTQMSRLAEALRAAGCWTEPQIQESFERTWKAQGLAVRPDHQMIGHTGFLVISRAMASGFEALRKRDRVTKDTQTDIDSLTDEQREAQIEELELRDISDHKLRKVLRDLDRQVGELGNTHE